MLEASHHLWHIHAYLKLVDFWLIIFQELIPIINWETTTFSTPVLAVLLFASVALFPTLLLPSTPSMWVAGMTFGYGFGFLLIISAAAVGVSLPYFIGSLFLHKIEVLILHRVFMFNYLLFFLNFMCLMYFLNPWYRGG